MMLSCLGVLVCALNPSLTRSIAAALYGPQGAGADAASGGNAVSVLGNVLKEESEDIANLPQKNNFGPGSGTGIRPGNVSYVVPVDDQVTAPESVTDKNGYEPIQEAGQEVADTEANSLQNSLTTGDVGEGLTFDAEFYPYYAMLESDMQTLYRQIYANAMDLTKDFAPVVQVSASQLKNVFEAVYNDHPELFWLDSGYSCKYTRSGQCVEISLQYNHTVNNLSIAQDDFNAKAQSILSAARVLGSDYEKEKYVHDALMSLTDYDTSSAINQSAYSALVSGKSVCAGYARAYQYLLQQLQIPCYYCTGYSGQNHAWNIVRLDRNYYNVDVTWDDTDPASYDYFNKTDAEFADTHVRKGLSVYLPACEGGAHGGVETEPPAQVNVNSTGNLDAPITMDSVRPGSTGGGNPSEEDAEALKKAGVSASEVMWDLNTYYADCLAQTQRVGAGEQNFTNVVPAALWTTIEQQYANGGYQTGYATEALKKMGRSTLSILVQAENLGGGFYRLYHYTSIY
ncbi:MAG: hypothetical protein NC417_04840 [Candidatus Gastranaerophilales bacterium]|nr:hypothetical protein [Candidatus Gastranaerophilales bacterium]